MKFIIDILKGCVMGIANVIPGVSGGTMAVSMGIYDRLITALTHLLKEFKKSFVTVLPIGIGMVIGILGLSRLIEWMFGIIPVQTNLFFIGLILGGLPMIIKEVKGKKVNAGCVVGFIFFFLLVAIFSPYSSNLSFMFALFKPSSLVLNKLIISSLLMADNCLYS